MDILELNKKMIRLAIERVSLEKVTEKEKHCKDLMAQSPEGKAYDYLHQTKIFVMGNVDGLEDEIREAAIELHKTLPGKPSQFVGGKIQINQTTEIKLDDIKARAWADKNTTFLKLDTKALESHVKAVGEKGGFDFATITKVPKAIIASKLADLIPTTNPNDSEETAEIRQVLDIPADQPIQTLELIPEEVKPWLNGGKVEAKDVPPISGSELPPYAWDEPPAGSCGPSQQP